MPPVVFPIGAYRKELAADHLDRLLGKSILDWFIHECSVTKDSHTSCANEPEGGSKGGSPETQRHGDTQQRSVELRGIEATEADIQIPTTQLVNPVETAGDQDDNKEENEVGQQAVDAQHHKDHGIVAGEVRQVVVDSALHLTKVGRLGYALHVEELGDGAQVGKASGQGLAADVVEAITKTRSDRVDGNLNSHDSELMGN